MATYQGMPIIYRTTNDGYHYGFIAGNITNGGATADILCHHNGDTWEDTTNDIVTTAQTYLDADMGTGLGEWMPNPDLPPEPPDLSEYLASGAAGNGARSLNTPFQPNAGGKTLVIYSVRVAAAVSIAGGALGRVELRCDASNPPTTSRCRVAGGLTGTVVVGVTMTDTTEGVLSYIVPAGHYVSLVTVNETGTPTYTLTQQYEIPL